MDYRNVISYWGMSPFLQQLRDKHLLILFYLSVFVTNQVEKWVMHHCGTAKSVGRSWETGGPGAIEPQDGKVPRGSELRIHSFI